MMAPRRRGKSNGLIGLLIGSAVAGVGLSAGRDIYRKGKDNLLTFIFLFAIAGGTAYGAWNIARGHDRTPAETFWKTYVLNGAIIAVTTILFMWIVFDKTNPDYSRAFAFSVTIQGAIAILGAFIGLIQRPSRMKRFAIARYNRDFLDQNGFRDVGGNEPVLIAPDGAELKLEDERDDALIFKVVGRRSVRAKIILDPKGRMVRYVPV